MKLLVIGHSVLDKIHSDGGLKIQPGGIYYTVLSLTNIVNSEDDVTLLSSMDKQNEKLFEPLFSKVNDNLIERVGAIPKVELRLSKFSERCEAYENLTNKLEIKDDLNLNQYKGILINMITGFDIDVDDLKAIRKKYDGKIFLDVHTLSRGYDENGKREFRVIPKSDEWIKSADIIQVNETELFSLSSKKNREEIIDYVFNLGLEILIVTQGNKGAEVFYQEGQKISNLFEKALDVKTENSIGCGDVFGSAFFYLYIKRGNIKEALVFANKAAGITASYANLEEFNNLKNDIIGKFN